MGSGIGIGDSMLHSLAGWRVCHFIAWGCAAILKGMIQPCRCMDFIKRLDNMQVGSMGSTVVAARSSRVAASCEH